MVQCVIGMRKGRSIFKISVGKATGKIYIGRSGGIDVGDTVRMTQRNRCQCEKFDRFIPKQGLLDKPFKSCSEPPDYTTHGFNLVLRGCLYSVNQDYQEVSFLVIVTSNIASLNAILTINKIKLKRVIDQADHTSHVRSY